MSLNLFYDHETGKLINVLFSSDFKPKIYEHYYTPYEEMVEVYMDLRTGRGFSMLPKNYETMWNVKPKDECIKKYHELQNKINYLYKKMG